MNQKTKTKLKYFLITLPFLIFVFAFSYVPLFGWAIAFSDFRMGQRFTDITFVGLKHFIKLIGDSDILRVLQNTLAMSFLKILFSPLPIVFAILFNEIRSVRTKKVVQTVATLPNFISWVVVYGLGFALFSSQGVFNQVCKSLSLPYSPYGLIGDGDHVWAFQTALSIWKSVGWETIIYMATIVGLDMELFDAAKVDGANKLQLIRHVTIPGLMPTYLVLLLLNVSNLLNSGFDQYYTFWNSMVSNKIEVLDYYVYRIAFTAGQYPYSIAIGMLKSILSILLLLFVNWVAKKVRGSSLI